MSLALIYHRDLLPQMCSTASNVFSASPPLSTASTLLSIVQVSNLYTINLFALYMMKKHIHRPVLNSMWNRLCPTAI